MSDLLRIYATVVSKTIDEYPNETISFEFKQFQEIAEKPETYIPTAEELHTHVPERQPLPYLSVKCSPLATGLPLNLFPLHAFTPDLISFDVYEKNEFLNESSPEAICSYGANEATILGRLTSSIDLTEAEQVIDVEFQLISSDDERLPEDYYNRLYEFFYDDILTNWILLTDIDYPSFPPDEDTPIEAYGNGYIFRVFRSLILNPDPLHLQLHGFLDVDVGARKYFKKIDAGKTVALFNPNSGPAMYGTTLIPIPNLFNCLLSFVGTERDTIATTRTVFYPDNPVRTENDGVVSSQYSSYPEPYITANAELNPIPGGTDTGFVITKTDTLDLRLYFYSPRAIGADNNPSQVIPSKGLEPTTSLSSATVETVTDIHNVRFEFSGGGRTYTKEFQVTNKGYRVSVSEIVSGLGGAMSFNVSAYLKLATNENPDDYFTESQSNVISVEVINV